MLVGNSKRMQLLYQKLAHIMRSSASILITGESGTGKELVATAIHLNSKRAKRPMIKVNCGAIPESLIESELFGHEKGSFTGAVTKRTGKFEAANGGTIFLDEIGELPKLMQVKLLRVLQEQEFDRVGSDTPTKIDVRVICATNKDLKKEIEVGNFREDLYYRIAGITVETPTLRERLEDIPRLVCYILRSKKHTDRTFSVAAMALLQQYNWPGNIRELENVIEHALAFADDDGEIKPSALPVVFQRATDEVVGISLYDLLSTTVPHTHIGYQQHANRVTLTTGLHHAPKHQYPARP